MPENWCAPGGLQKFLLEALSAPRNRPVQQRFCQLFLHLWRRRHVQKLVRARLPGGLQKLLPEALSALRNPCSDDFVKSFGISGADAGLALLVTLFEVIHLLASQTRRASVGSSAGGLFADTVAAPKPLASEPRAPGFAAEAGRAEEARGAELPSLVLLASKLLERTQPAAGQGPDALAHDRK